MSTFNRNTLALALAAALLPASAFAFNVTTSGDAIPQPLAAQIGPATPAGGMTEVIEIRADGVTDQLPGRTTGFGLRVKIIQAGVTITGGVAATGAGMNPPPTGNTWNVVQQGAFGSNTAVWNVTPANPGVSTINVGPILTITGLGLAGMSVTPGDAVAATVELFDPNTNAVIASTNGSLILRTDGLAFSCTPTAVPNKVDVGTSVFAPTTKTAFVAGPAYIIGGANAAAANTALGLVSVAATGGFTLNVAAGGDTLTSKITGADLSAFVGAPGAIFLGDATCANVWGAYTVTVPATGVPTVANLNLPFATLNTAGAAFAAGGGSATLCVRAKGGTQQIEGQQFLVQNGINTKLEADACNVSPIEFNGSTVKVFTFNPAGNTTQESFIRVSNTGTTGGRVTITSKADNGAAGASAVTFQLAAGNSIQLTSEDLQNGNAAKGLTGSFGANNGKWRLVVTGEFDGMIVTSLNRNNTTGTVTNLTDADSRLEQLNDAK